MPIVCPEPEIANRTFSPALIRPDSIWSHMATKWVVVAVLPRLEMLSSVFPSCETFLPNALLIARMPSRRLRREVWWMIRWSVFFGRPGTLLEHVLRVHHRLLRRDRRVPDRVRHVHDRPAVRLVGQLADAHAVVAADAVQLQLVEADAAVLGRFDQHGRAGVADGEAGDPRIEEAVDLDLGSW